MEPYLIARGQVWHDNKIQAFLLSHQGLVLERNNELLACGFFEVRERQLHIHTLQVVERYQNLGLGKHFFHWFLNYCRSREIPEITCSVFAENPAFKLYLRLGFEQLVEEETQDESVKLRLNLNRNREVNRFSRSAIN